MSGRLIKPPPTTDPELVRSLEQRIRDLESKQTLRLGEWVLSADPVTGNPVLVKPGEINDVGMPVAEQVDLGAVRGYVTESQVAQAVSGGITNNLSVATTTQVGRDTATGNAQYTADNANALAQQLEAKINAGSNGMVWSDTFDRDAADTLGANYFRTQSGGAAAYGTDGEGFAASRFTSGFSPQDWTDRYLVPTNTNSMVVATTLDSIPQAGGGAGTQSSRHGLCARMNATNTELVRANVDNRSISMEYLLGGTYHTVVPNVGVDMADGDRWALLAIEAADPIYTLLRNGLSTISWTDYGHVFPVNADHRFGGMYNKAGNTISGFFFTVQLPAPKVQILNVADRA